MTSKELWKLMRNPLDRKQSNGDWNRNTGNFAARKDTMFRTKLHSPPHALRHPHETHLVVVDSLTCILVTVLKFAVWCLSMLVLLPLLCFLCVPVAILNRSPTLGCFCEFSILSLVLNSRVKVYQVATCHVISHPQC